MSQPAQTAASFWAQTMPDGECLVWTGHRQQGTSSKGPRQPYGRASYRGRIWPAHRLAWTFTYGPIPAGLFVCHTCDNPPCCNPRHLFLGTHALNQLDRAAKGRNALGGRSGEANAQAKLTAEQVRQIRALAAEGLSRRALGRQFGVSNQQVTKIVNRDRW